MKKAVVVFVVTCVLILAVFFGIYAMLHHEHYFYYRFSPELWQKVSKADESKRYFMAKYLMDQSTLIGMSEAQVEALLGEPDIAGGRPRYCLGPERGSIFQIDNDWLEIEFDEAQAVSRVWIRPD